MGELVQLHKVDLQPFCAYQGEHPSRKYLEAPFSCGDFTYATNGYIMVRVPRRPGVSDFKHKMRWDQPFVGRDDLSFHPVRLQIPGSSPVTGPCGMCGGCGFIDGDRSLLCELCDGDGWFDPELRVSARVKGLDLCVSYLRRIADLPDLVVASSTTPTGVPALQFGFEGGIGVLASLRGPYRKTVDIIVEAA